MKQTNLLASVALFSELYNSETYKSIPEILAEFIKGAIIYENKFSFNSTELKDLMIKVYEFNIPESVLRTVLHTKFKNSITFEAKNYHFSSEIREGLENINTSVEIIDDQQKGILNALFNFIIARVSHQINETEKNRIFRTFSHILMDNGYSDKYSDLISAFIISNENNKNVTDILNSIKEGLILYQGINYTADINELGSWNSELTIFLSTEHLFNFLNYNGTLFKEISEDFYRLVNEINTSQKNKKKKLINLKYLEETKNEVDYFFMSAESIFKGYKTLDPSKEAMKNILKGCNKISDIKAKQIKFYLDLKTLGIEYQSFHFDINDAQYNVIDQNVIDELELKSKERNKLFNIELCTSILQIFTKVNTFRKGNNKLPFERIGYIYITENRFAKYLAHQDKVKFQNYDIPFAKDLDFIISKFWFKLKKGFNNKNELPKSFDVTTKAKIILSSHINSSVSKNYEKLHEEFKQGKLTEEEAIALNFGLKEKADSLENITAENIENSISFLNDDEVLENFLREKTRKDTLHDQAIIEKNALAKIVQGYKEKEIEIENKKREAELEDSKNQFAKQQWKLHTKEIYSDTLYYLFVTLVTILPISIGMLLKVIPLFNQWMISIGNYQYIIWAFLILIFVIELQGRSYLFNKVKVANGFYFIKLIISFQYKKYKREKTHEYKESFLHVLI